MGDEKPPVERLTYSVPELAEAMGLSHVTLYRFINSGVLKSFTVGRRRLISRKEAEAFVAYLESNGVNET
jgi:excisionase family DNA binding protein